MTRTLLLAFLLGLAPTLLLADAPEDPGARLDRLIDAFLERFDRNDDGAVTPDEYPDRARFDRLDRDGDGRVTRGDFYRVLPPRSAMEDDPEQGPKNSGGGYKAVGAQLSFRLMMPVDAKTWPRLMPYARNGDLYWGKVDDLPLGMRGHVTTGAPVSVDDLKRCRHVVLDVRDAGVSGPEAVKRTEAVLASIAAGNAACKDLPGWGRRQLLGWYTPAQLRASAQLSKLADVVMIGDATWGTLHLRGAADVKPETLLATVELAGRLPAVCFGVTRANQLRGEAIEKLLRHCMGAPKHGGLGLDHVAIICNDDRLHLLLDALSRVR